MMWFVVLFDMYVMFHIISLTDFRKDEALQRGPIDPKERLLNGRGWKRVVVHSVGHVLYLVSVIVFGTNFLNQVNSEDEQTPARTQKGFETMDNMIFAIFVSLQLFLLAILVRANTKKEWAAHSLMYILLVGALDLEWKLVF